MVIREVNKTKKSERLVLRTYKQLLSLRGETPEEDNINQHKKDDFVHSYIDLLITEYEKSNNREGLSIIIRDLTGLFGTREHPEKIKELYTLMPEKEKNTFSDQRIQNFFNQHEYLAFGQPVDFDFTDFNGYVGKVSDYKGKLVLIEFWATWCGPCLALFPMMEKLTVFLIICYCRRTVKYYEKASLSAKYLLYLNSIKLKVNCKTGQTKKPNSRFGVCKAGALLLARRSERRYDERGTSGKRSLSTVQRVVGYRKGIQGDQRNS